MSDKPEIIAFIEARESEREDVANAAINTAQCHCHTGLDTSVWEWDDHDRSIVVAGTEHQHEVACPSSYDDELAPYYGEHIRTHDPRWVLADVASKRIILAWAQTYTQQCIRDGLTPQDVPLLKALAAPYADHPEFHEAWR